MTRGFEEAFSGPSRLRLGIGADLTSGMAELSVSKRLADNWALFARGQYTYGWATRQHYLAAGAGLEVRF